MAALCDEVAKMSIPAEPDMKQVGRVPAAWCRVAQSRTGVAAAVGRQLGVQLQAARYGESMRGIMRRMLACAWMGRLVLVGSQVAQWLPTIARLHMS